MLNREIAASWQIGTRFLISDQLWAVDAIDGTSPWERPVTARLPRQPGHNAGTLTPRPLGPSRLRRALGILAHDLIGRELVMAQRFQPSRVRKRTNRGPPMLLTHHADEVSLILPESLPAPRRETPPASKSFKFRGAVDTPIRPSPA